MASRSLSEPPSPCVPSTRSTPFLPCVARLTYSPSPQIPVVLVDSAAYQKLVVVPLNIIRYNLFPVAGAGPELYGTEPWYFYVLNGLISFNIIFPLALVAPLLILVTLRVDPKRFGDARDVSKEQTHPAMSLAIRLAPLHLYLAILMLQKHKEERFLFPAYGHVVLNAAVGLYLVRGWVEAYFLKVTQSPYRVRPPLSAALFSPSLRRD